MSDYSGEVFWFNQIARNEQGKILAPNWDMLAQAVQHVAEETSELQVAEDALSRRFHMSESETESLEAVAEVADAALDLVYVAFNVLYALGARPRPLWTAIHSANLKKIPPCPHCRTDGVVLDEAGVEQECEPCEGLGYLPPIRNEHGKIMKPPGWQAPDLVPLLRAQWEKQR